MFCKKCGKEAKSSESFCGHCGNDLRTEGILETKYTDEPKSQWIKDLKNKWEGKSANGPVGPQPTRQAEEFSKPKKENCANSSIEMMNAENNKKRGSVHPESPLFNDEGIGDFFSGIRAPFSSQSSQRQITLGSLYSGQGLTEVSSPVSVEINFSYEKLNIAMMHCAVPFITQLTVKNHTKRNMENILIRLSLLPDLGGAWEKSISVAAEDSFSIASVSLPLDKESYKKITEEQTRSLKIEVIAKGETIFSDMKNIKLHAFNEWIYDPLLPEVLRSFMSPNSEEIQKVLDTAEPILKELTGQDGWPGYQKGDRLFVLCMVTAIYEALKSKIGYINPPASFEKTGQKILMTEQISQMGRGTCLDLAIFFAACLERCGLFPMIFLVPGHALLGVWLDKDSYRNFWSKWDVDLKEWLSKDDFSGHDESYSIAKKATTYLEILSYRCKSIQNYLDNGLKKFGETNKELPADLVRSLPFLPLNSTTFTGKGNILKCIVDGTNYILGDLEAVIDVNRASSEPGGVYHYYLNKNYCFKPLE